MYQHIQIHFGIFQFKLTLETFYSVLKLDYHFGFTETREVILSLHTSSFSPKNRICVALIHLRDVLGDYREARKVMKSLELNG